MANKLMGDTGAGATQAGPVVTRAELDKAEEHLNLLMKHLTGLSGRAKGDLKREHFLTVITHMLEAGAFGDEKAKRHLVSEIAKLPSDEEGIRKVIGAHIVATADHLAHVKAHRSVHTGG